MTRKTIYSALASAALLLLPVAALADTVTSDFESSTYSVGNINGQDGWVKTGSFDVAVTATSSIPAAFGLQSLRISDAVTSGSFGDQTFSKALVNEAGETDALSGGMSSGVRQPHFEAQFDLASILPTLQSGMHMSVSPDRGDGARMSYLLFEDVATGIDVYFVDVQGTSNPANFVRTAIASTTRTAHTIKFVMDFVDGPSNDVVKIYIDGILKHTGTSWENYYRYDSESYVGNNSRTVDSLLFRESGDAHTANNGYGFLIDNLSLVSSATPVQAEPQVHIFKYVDGVQATAANANSSAFPMLTTFDSTVYGLVTDAPFTLSPTGWGATDVAYEASYVGGAAGDNYATHEVTSGNEIVGATCAAGKPFALDGYTTGTSLVDAASGVKSSTIPSFTNLQSDQYVIVWNVSCTTVPPVVTDPKDACKNDGWKTYPGNHNFKNQGQCIQYVNTGK